MIARNEKATVLLVTLWILAILSLLAIGIGFRTSIDLKLVSYQIDKLKAYEIAKAGIAKALSELEKDQTPDIDTLWECGIALKYNETFDGKFRNVRIGDGYFNIPSIDDVWGKININTAPKDILMNLFSGAENPGEISDNIMAWRGYAGEGVPLPLSPDYSDKSYGNKKAPFDAVSELLLVKDIAQEGQVPAGPQEPVPPGTSGEEAGIEDLITVYPKDPNESFKVNINTASQKVLEILFRSAGLDEAIAVKIVDDRSGRDKKLTTRDDNIFCQSDNAQNIQQFIKDEAGASYQASAEEAQALTKLCNWLTVKANYFEISSMGTLAGRKSNIHKTITCVIKRDLSSATSKPEIISWVED